MTKEIKAPSLQEEIAQLNARLKDLESRVPAPKPVPIPQKEHYSQLKKELYVLNHTENTRTGPIFCEDRKDHWNIKNALADAKERQKKLGWPIKFYPWDKDWNVDKPPHQTICIVEELHALGQASSMNCYRLIRDWNFVQPIPKEMIEQSVPAI
jgi:hypothetical protein